MKNKFFQIVDTEIEIAALGIIAIASLEGLALLKGVDGTMFGASMAAVGVIIGWVFKGYRSKIKDKKSL